MAKARIPQHVEKIQEIQIKTRSLEMKLGTQRIRSLSSVRWRGGKAILQNYERNV